MKSWIRFLCLLSLVLPYSSVLAEPEATLNTQAPLSVEEQDWIKAHPQVTVGAEPDWVPFSFAGQNGQFLGIAKDYLSLIFKKTGLKINVSMDQWSNQLQKLRDKEIDLLAAAYFNEARSKFATYSPPYFKILRYFFIRDDLNLKTLEDLNGKRVAIPKDNANIKILKEYFPRIEIMEVKDFHAAIDAVLENKAAMLYDNYTTLSSLLKREAISTIVPFKSTRDLGNSTIHFISRNDAPELASIIQKGLDAISEMETQAIYSKWLTNKPVKNKQPLDLTNKEQEWLKEHKDIRLGADSNWPPYEFIGKSGKLQGLGADIIKEVEKKIGVQFELTLEPSWSQTLNKVRNKEIDMVGSIIQTTSRLKYMWFTDSYYTPPNSIFTRKDGPSISSLDDLETKTIAVENHYYLHERLSEDYPNIKLLPFETTADALKAVSYGKADAYVGNQGAANWVAEQYTLTNLKAAHVISEIGTAPLRLAVRKDWPILQSILNKALASIPDADFMSIRRKWMGLNSTTKELSLSTEEQQWLDNHTLIRFTGDPNWLPYEAFDEQGNYIGIVAEHLNLIEKKLGINVEIIPAKTWSESVEKVRTEEVDIISETTDSDLTSDLVFTQSYLSSPIVIIMESDNDYIENIDQIKPRKIAVIRDYGYVPEIIRKHPDIDFHIVDSIQDGLTAVSTGKVDALLATLAQASYHISELGINNIRIVGKTEFTTRLAFGMRKDFAPLVPLFNRALSTISIGEKQKILNTWGKEKFAKNIDYSLLAKLAAALLSIIAIVIYWNRKLAKEIKQRKDLEAQTQALIDTIPLQIFVTSVSGNILYANPQALNENNVKKEAIGKHNILEFYKDTRDRESVLNELSSKGKINQKILPIKLLDGTVRSMMISIMPTRYHDQQALLTISLDVTKRIETEEALQNAKESAEAASHFKSQFLANMSHEIRTPMNAIIGLGHLLSRTSLDTKQHDYVEKMEGSAQSLLGIIDDILDFSKIEAGQLKIENIEFDLEDVLRNLTTLISTRIKDKPLEYIYRIDTDIPPNLIGDPYRLGQILTNLVGNAIKFTEQGHILLSVIVQQKEPLHLQFSVEDTGIGISKEKINGLFEPFTQADGSTTRNYGGTGLGLSISHQLTELMGGEISATSQPNQGSRFQINLPFKVGAKIPLLRPATDLQGLRILLVDDNPTTLEALSEMLTLLSFRVEEVLSGSDALKKIRSTNTDYDLILLDWRMPQADGIEIAKRIHTEYSGNRPPKIILMTAFGREAVEHKIDRQHLDGFLVKPITPSQMLDTIAETMNATKPSDLATPQDALEAPYVQPLTGQILLAEDNPINQQVAREILEQMGLTVEICNNGVEAVASVRKRRPDLVIMDIQMPKMDGFEATSQIRQIKGMETLPIIAMTANAMIGDAERSLLAGMNDHVAKPVDPALLYETVKSWLEKQMDRHPHSFSERGDSKSWKIKLPGIDLQQGLKQVGGNQELYIKLLSEFLNSHAGSAKQLHEHLNNSRLKPAQRLAHTLRGTAGTLGATQLEQSAHEIDNTLRGNLSVSKVQINTLNQASDELFQSLSKWLPKQNKT